MPAKILVAGLGNHFLNGTRHSIGLSILDLVLADLGLVLKANKKCKSATTHSIVGGSEIVFLKPLLPMNLNGECIRCIVDSDQIPSENVLLIHDDLDYPLGVIKCKNKGSSGGHRGVQSVIDHLKTEQFTRFRVGIGRPVGRLGVVDFVLSRFKRDEMALVSRTETRCATMVMDLLLRQQLGAKNSARIEST